MQELLETQRIIDAEHLRLLRIGFFVSAGTTGMFALIGVLYGCMGLMFNAMANHMPHNIGQPGLPPQFGWIFGLFGFGFALAGGTVAALKLRVARCLRERQSHAFCIVMSVISCLEMPYGTAFGVFACLTLSRPTVKRLFFEHAANR